MYNILFLEIFCWGGLYLLSLTAMCYYLAILSDEIYFHYRWVVTEKSFTKV